MSTNEENRLVDAIINLSQEIKGLRKDMNRQFGDLNHRVDGLNHRVEKLEKQQAKTNLALGEMRLSYMKLSDEVSGLRSDFIRYAESNSALVNNHETRIVRLEEKTSGNSYIAMEPVVEYKKKKRK